MGESFRAHYGMQTEQQKQKLTLRRPPSFANSPHDLPSVNAGRHLCTLMSLGKRVPSRAMWSALRSGLFVGYLAKATSRKSRR